MLTVDDMLMNSAYLSEKWAVRDLIRFKEINPNAWSSEREEQLVDEDRHVQMCLNALQKNLEEHKIVHDLNYAMQERLHKAIGNIELETDDESKFTAIQLAMEERAIWIYRSYMLVGKNQNYKKMFTTIIKDEIPHLQIGERNTFEYEQIKKKDNKLFDDLSKKYGRIILASNEFWDYYYAGREDNSLRS